MVRCVSLLQFVPLSDGFEAWARSKASGLGWERRGIAIPKAYGQILNFLSIRVKGKVVFEIRMR